MDDFSTRANRRKREANMREIFSFDSDTAFQVRAPDGTILAECESLADAERVLDKQPPGSFIAFPREALDAENERRAANEEHERQQRIRRKRETEHAELVSLARIAVLGDAMHLLFHSGELHKVLGREFLPDEIDDIREETRAKYEAELVGFFNACKLNGRALP